MFVDALMDAALDSARMLPFLFVIYALIEFVEYRFGNRMGQAIGRAGIAGPFIGALAGSVPQCGISVMASALYTQRLVTIGTLLAVLLSTSDEAIPVILSQPDKISMIVPILVAKICIALIVGYLLDLVFRKYNRETLAHINAFENGHDDEEHNHSEVLDETACCGHTPGAKRESFHARQFFKHPLEHTLKVFIFIFLISLALNLIIAYVGEETFAAALAQVTFAQPFFAALVGLIPNCAASVVVTELYLDGAITFAAVISGLCASGGLGILVLLKDCKSKKEALGIVGLLFAISIIAGFVCGFFAPATL